MNHYTPPLLLLLTAMIAPFEGATQGIVVDQGEFSVTINNRTSGSEEFTIRRAGIGRDDAIFANAVVRFETAGGQEVRPLLRASPPAGIATSYQVEVDGSDALALQLRLAGQLRYVAIISSALGEEHREFPALPDTRVLEQDVAHHYYFLRDAREGTTIPVLEPRTRSRFLLQVSAPQDEELQLGQRLFQTRRVEFFAGEDRRVVWYDRLGRVLRVSIPLRGYLAERTGVF